jgi:hypothetical protein
MTNNNEADLLAAELDKDIEENKIFLDNIDEQIKEIDLDYAQTLIKDKKDYLNLAKRALEKK